MSIFGPFALGRSVASAGLKIPFILPTISNPDAKSAPVLPIESIASPSPFFSIFAATTTDAFFLLLTAFAGSSWFVITSSAFAILILSFG